MYNIALLERTDGLKHHLKYQIVHKDIVRHDKETIVTFEPESNCQCHFSPSVHN